MSISKTFVAPQFVMVEDDGEVIVSDRALLNDVLNVERLRLHRTASSVAEPISQQGAGAA